MVVPRRRDDPSLIRGSGEADFLPSGSSIVSTTPPRQPIAQVGGLTARGNARRSAQCARVIQAMNAQLATRADVTRTSAERSDARLPFPQTSPSMATSM